MEPNCRRQVRATRICLAIVEASGVRTYRSKSRVRTFAYSRQLAVPRIAIERSFNSTSRTGLLAKGVLLIEQRGGVSTTDLPTIPAPASRPPLLSLWLQPRQ